MKKTILLIILILFVFSSVSVAGDYPFLKKEHPNELNVSVYVRAETDLTENQIQDTVFAKLRRARIKPLAGYILLPEGEIFLRVSVYGDFKKDKSGPLLIKVNFVTLVPKFQYVTIGGGAHYYGIGNSATALEQIKNILEIVLDDYLKENFDL